MRLLHLSDLHLGYRQFQRQTPAGINQREADVASVFRGVIDKIIALRPDVVCIAGDVFHNVRPSNPAILHAFQQFSRLMQALPGTIVVMVAGNHDTPRAAETGCILRLFSPLGIYVVDAEPERFAFAERGLSILAVPEGAATRIALDPDPAFRYNVLVMHQLLDGVLPSYGADPDGAMPLIRLEDIGPPRWTYVALGNYHVYHHLAPNAFYSGSIEYTSLNIWGDVRRERERKVSGKGMVEFDLETGKHAFHKIRPARALVDLPLVSGRGMTAADVDGAIRENVERVGGGIEKKIVRQVVRDVPRHVAREMDHKAIREYMRRALHFHLDTRRPELVRPSAAGAAGRRPSLTEMVRDKLRARVIPPDVERDPFVDLGLHYLREADAIETASLTPALETE